MTSTAGSFTPGVRDSGGLWPAPPATWSYTSLRDATDCPRRWMLSRATYPGLWDRRGYPPQPGLTALAGDIIHAAVDTVLTALRAHGCRTSADPAAVAVLKGIGGYTRLVEDGIASALAALAGNPRAAGKTTALGTALQVKVPEMRQRIQSMIARAPVSLAADDPAAAASPGSPGPLPAGSYPEADLHAPDLRLAGRADLLTVTADGCEITDYKTGSADPRHADQVRLYALIWSRDTVLNPGGLPARRLILSYPSRDEDVQPPTAAELDALAAGTTAQIAAAEAALRDRPPPARPSRVNCALCGVRQLCDDYWAFLARRPADGRAPEWLDFEGTAIRQNGPRSWLLASGADGSQLLLRTLTEQVPFTTGDTLRVLGLRHAAPDAAVPAAAMTQMSEIFIMDSPAPDHR